VTDDLAVVWCHRKTYYKWLGAEKDPGRQDERRLVSRFDHGIPQGAGYVAASSTCIFPPPASSRDPAESKDYSAT